MDIFSKKHSCSMEFIYKILFVKMTFFLDLIILKISPNSKNLKVLSFEQCLDCYYKGQNI